MGASRVKEERTRPFRIEGKGQTRLLFVLDGGRSIAHELPREGRITIGRASDCDVRVAHPSVSRRHAAIQVGDEVTVEDLGSVNGVRLGQHRLAIGEPVPVSVGEAIRIGGVLAVIQEPSPSAATAAPIDESGIRRKTPVALDPASREVFQTVERIAPTDLNVLLTGETGSGKEVLAEELHLASPRRHGPFVPVHCGAMPEALVESELFGYVKGAFTGATESRSGLLEMAAGGTVFLDEIGEISPAVQAKLLRVIQDRTVRPLGGGRARVVDVRFVCATHRDLDVAIETGRFRPDLYYRLNGISIHVPALRERPRDLAPLAERFLKEAADRHGLSPVPALDDEAIETLQRHPWPGNVRELRNLMHRLAALASGPTLGLEDLPLELRTSTPPSAQSLRPEVEAFEREKILEALGACDGNQTRAAKRLGMSRRALIDRLDKYDIPRPRKGRRNGKA